MPHHLIQVVPLPCLKKMGGQLGFGHNSVALVDSQTRKTVAHSESLSFAVYFFARSLSKAASSRMATPRDWAFASFEPGSAPATT